MSLLTVDNLRTCFHTRDGVVSAVDGVSFHIDEGETLGVVGESGSGKSVTCYSLLRLLPMPPARIESGEALFEGVDLLRMSDAGIRAVRGREISMVFQDPMTALNPYMTIGAQVMEPLRVHEGLSRHEAAARAQAMLQSVGIPGAASRMSAYPHQFSGGMRQRVMLAQALVTRPKLLLADEPTTALDVTVQAEILALLKDLQRSLGMTVLLVTHNLGVVAGTCDRVLVMYAGRVMETADTRALFEQARHPYTLALLATLPDVHQPNERLYSIPGMPPDLSKPILGCPFAPRCVHVRDDCRTRRPRLAKVSAGHAAACLRVEDGSL